MDDSLYLKNENLVYYVLNKEYPSLLKDEDAVQEAKIALWKACRTYDKTKSTAGSFSTYAYTIIKNSMYNFVVKAWRRRGGKYASIVSLNQLINEDSTDSHAELQDLVSNDMVGEENPYTSSEAQMVFLEALKRCGLSKVEYSICIRLASGMTQTEIAKADGCARQNIHNHVKKIRKKILANKEFFSDFGLYL